MNAAFRGALAAVLLASLLVPAAAAHVGVQSSVPADGAVLDEAPHVVTVTLNGPIDADGANLRVRDGNGTRVDLGDIFETGGDRPMLGVTLRADLPDGAYQVTWQAVSADDGHPASGKVGFAVGNHTPPSSSGGEGPFVPWLGAAGRLVAFIGLALGLGAALFLVWVPGAVAVPRRPALEMLLAGAALHLLGVVLLLKSTMDQAGLSDADLAATSIGKVLLLRLGLGIAALAFAGIAMLPRVPARLPPHLAVLLLAASGLGSARFGHASAYGVAGITVDAMHLLAAAAWIGGLLVFLWLLIDAARNGWTADAIRLAGVRFGTAALVSVIVLLTAGIGTTLAILGPEAWRDPARTLGALWGKLLAAKVALTLAMLGLAVVNRYGILEPARTGGFSGSMQRLVTRRAPGLRVLDGGAPGMRRLLAIEATFGVLTLALAAILTSIAPPADAVHRGAAAVEVQGFGAQFHGTLRIDPGPVAGGTSELRVRIATHAGAPVADNTCGRTAPDSCVSAVVGEGGGVLVLQPTGDGEWMVAGVRWTASGDLRVTVRVSTADVDSDPLSFLVPVAPNA